MTLARSEQNMKFSSSGTERTLITPTERLLVQARTLCCVSCFFRVFNCVWGLCEKEKLLTKRAVECFFKALLVVCTTEVSIEARGQMFCVCSTFYYS